MSEVKQFIYFLKKIKLETLPFSSGKIKLNEEGLLEFSTNKKIVISEFGMYNIDIGLRLRLKKKILNPLNYCLFISNHLESEIYKKGIYIPEFIIGLPNNKWVDIVLPFVNPIGKQLILPSGGLICKAILQTYNYPKIKN